MIKINTLESGKTIALTALTPEVITVCNVEVINTDESTFKYDPETGELTILRNVVAEIDGCLFLIDPINLTADLTINLVLNGTPIFVLYSGLENQRQFSPYIKSFVQNDIITFEVTDQNTDTIETSTEESYITVKRKY